MSRYLLWSCSNGSSSVSDVVGLSNARREALLNLIFAVLLRLETIATTTTAMTTTMTTTKTADLEDDLSSLLQERERMVEEVDERGLESDFELSDENHVPYLIQVNKTYHTIHTPSTCYNTYYNTPDI